MHGQQNIKFKSTTSPERIIFLFQLAGHQAVSIECLVYGVHLQDKMSERKYSSYVFSEE